MVNIIQCPLCGHKIILAEKKDEIDAMAHRFEGPPPEEVERLNDLFEN